MATDTIFSDTPAIDDGSTSAQLFVGRNSLVTDVYGMKSLKQFVNTLEDNVRKRGAMDKLISDRAQLEISGRVHDFLRSLCIDDWQSEPHHQWQNFAENRWKTVKSYTNNVLNRTGAPAYTWLLCIQWICHVLNHLAAPLLNYRTPMEALTGITPDISPMLLFYFWEPVYYHDPTDEDSFPSSTNEKLGRFVGIAESVGDALTFKVLTDDTMKVLFRSTVRSALNLNERNRRLPQLDELDLNAPQVIRSRSDSKGESSQAVLPTMPTIPPDTLIGRSILLPEDQNGE